MPELPEVEAVCRRIRPQVRGRTIERANIPRPAITRPQDASETEEILRGRRIEKVLRRGKNILIRTSGTGPDRVLRIHLRMTGNLNVIPDARTPPPATRMSLEFADGGALIFIDFRALGRVHLHTVAEIESLLEDLGPEPLSRQFTVEALAASARASNQPSKLFLMDQRRISGLGNIYAAEALFQAKIHPAKKMKTLRRSKIEALHAAIVDVLRRAVKTTAAAYKRPGYWGGEEWDFPLRVYGRKGQPCLVCGSAIRSMRQGGRSTYYCPHCQK